MKLNPIPRVISLIIISVGVACLMRSFDISALAKLDSMPAADYIQHQRDLHHQSFTFHFITMLIMGGFYVGAVEFLAYMIGSLIPKRTDA